MFSKRIIAFVEQAITPAVFSTGQQLPVAQNPLAAAINTRAGGRKRGAGDSHCGFRGVVKEVIAEAERVVFMHRAVGEERPPRPLDSNLSP